MRIQWATVISVAVIGAATANAEEKIDADVYLSDSYSSARILKQHKTIVSSIFLAAGVKIHWHDGKTVPGAFEIRVVKFAPPSASKDALAATRIASADITIFEDRVLRRLSFAHLAEANVAPAYIVAHELAHAMQGEFRHSETGILKAHFDSDDFTAMYFKKFAFTDWDAKLLRIGLSARSASRQIAGADFERK